jgi:hypothetical protein
MYVSFSIGLLLIIVAQALPQYILLKDLVPNTFVGATLMWLKMSTAILVLIIMKSTVTFSLSYLFGISDNADIHALNTMRIFLQLALVTTMLGSIYFIARGQNIQIYIFLYKTLGVMLFGWVILMYFKMRSKASCSPFHLFSYLCATEIVTLIVLSKVLYQ